MEIKIFKKEPYYLTTDYFEVYTLICEYFSKRDLLKGWIISAIPNLSLYGIYTKRINMIDMIRMGVYIGWNLTRYSDFELSPNTRHITGIYRMKKPN